VKILRVSIGYPTEDVPGSGLNVYYHTLYSNEQDMIITEKKDSKLVSNRQDVNIVQIPLKKIKLKDSSTNLVESIFLFLRKIWSQYIFFRQSKKIIDTFKPDLVHIYTPIPIFFGSYCKRKYGSKYIMSLHGSDVERIKKNKIIQLIMRKPDNVVTVGKEMINELNFLKLKRPITYIGNGVDIREFYNKHYTRKKQFIQVGSFRWQKGKQYLIEAFYKFNKEYPEYRLVLVGDGIERKRMEDLAEELGIKDSVDFLGMQSRANILELLNYSTAFILSSVSEGFPKVIYESMATGTPVISTDIVNVKEVIKDSGVVVPAKNSDALYEAMKEIINTDKWETYSIKAEEYVKEYTWDKVVERLNKVYFSE
jgi:glycosyltransferase involved in cell wall biosynthesis